MLAMENAVLERQGKPQEASARAIRSIEPRTHKTEILVHVALKQMFGYSTSLRSMSQGRGIFTMTFHTFGAL